MTSTDLVPVLDDAPERGRVTFAVLHTLGYTADDLARRTEVREFVELCWHYRLDPLANHVRIIETRQGPRIYVTVDGYREVAEQSGQLGGIRVVEVHEGETGVRVVVDVYRKDWPEPCTMPGGCGYGEPQAKAGKAVEMARTRAIRAALRFAFPIRGAFVHGAERDDDTDEIDPRDVAPVALESPTEPAAAPGPAPAPVAVTADGAPGPAKRDQGAAHAVASAWPPGTLAAFLAAWGIDTFGERWPDDAVDAVLDGTALANIAPEGGKS